MSWINWMWTAPKNIDAQYDNKPMSIGGGIDSRLEWITFTDYKTGKEIEMWSPEHKQYFIREQWIENADKIYRQDINQLLKELNLNNTVQNNVTTVVQKSYEPAMVEQTTEVSEPVVITEEAYVEPVAEVQQPVVKTQKKQPEYNVESAYWSVSTDVGRSTSIYELPSSSVLYGSLSLTRPPTLKSAVAL